MSVVINYTNMSHKEQHISSNTVYHQFIHFPTIYLEPEKNITPFFSSFKLKEEDNA